MDIDFYAKEVGRSKDNAIVLWKYNTSIGLILFPTLLVTLPLAIVISLIYVYKKDRLETSKATK
jgi:hypothetical protein